MRSISIIGCGQVGTVLGALFHNSAAMRVEALVDISIEKAKRANALIGEGTPQESLACLATSDLLLLSLPDSAIEGCVRELCEQCLVKAGTIVFHCSGALPSSALAPLAALGAHIGSVHPVRSFADFRQTVESFRGTYCGVEGDANATPILCELFTSLGARTFSIDAAHKEIYHAGAVFACNYLVALIEVSLRAYERAAVPREVALEVLQPLLRGTLDNIFARGLTSALSGPIVRGDAGAISRQVAAVGAWDSRAEMLYRMLGDVILDLIASNGSLTPGKIEALRQLLAGAH